MDVEMITNMGLHGFLILCVLYLARESRNTRKQLIECLQDKEVVPEDLTKMF